LSRGPDYSRSRAKDEAVRAQLEPLAPGERPLGLKLGIVLARAARAANAIAAAAINPTSACVSIFRCLEAASSRD